MRYQKAALDPLMRELVEDSEGITVEEGAQRAEAERQAKIEREASAGDDTEAADEEVQKRGFSARIENSRLDGRPAVCYPTTPACPRVRTRV